MAGPILLVEDNPDDVQLTQKEFERIHLHNRVIAIDSGDAAIAYFSDPDQALPELVILDLGLPGAPGIAVLRHLREQIRTAAIPVIVLTVSRAQVDKIESYRLGVNAYLRKPIQKASFMDAIFFLKIPWTLGAES